MIRLGRRGFFAAATIVLSGMSADGASAADRGARDLLFSPTAIYRPDRWEVRAGGYAHCCFVEKGAALGLEVVTPRPFVIPNLPEFLSPRLHFGGIVSLNGHTSYAYAGLLFTLNWQRFFLEPFVGIAISNGVALGDATHNAIGCTALIHAGGNIGYRVNRNWSVMLTADHISNANMCSRNAGLNNWGVKIGYSF